MPKTARIPCGAPVRVAPVLEILEPANADWWDLLVIRMAKELQKQLSQIESLRAKDTGKSSDRAANARTLDSLQRTMERLMRAEEARAAARERKVMSGDGKARKVLVRRLDKLLAAGPAPEIPHGDER